LALHGNPGKRPLNTNEPQPELGIPELPTMLNGEALLEWHRITVELLQLGLMTKVDRAALAAYCQAWGRWVEAEEHLKNGANDFQIALRPSGGVALVDRSEQGNGSDACISDGVRLIAGKPHARTPHPTKRKTTGRAEISGLTWVNSNFTCGQNGRSALVAFPWVRAELHWAWVFLSSVFIARAHPRTF